MYGWNIPQRVKPAELGATAETGLPPAGKSLLASVFLP